MQMPDGTSFSVETIMELKRSIMEGPKKGKPYNKEVYSTSVDPRTGIRSTTHYWTLHATKGYRKHKK